MRLVEAPRGMTKAEALNFLLTGEVPSFGPIDDTVASGTVSMIFGKGKGKVHDPTHHGWDPKQPRDAHGQWTRTPNGESVSGVFSAAHDKRFTSATRNDDIFDETPFTLGSSVKTTRTPSHVDEDAARKITRMMDVYVSDLFPFVNSALRNNRGNDLDPAGDVSPEIIEGIDDGMVHSRLRNDVVVYRGSTRPDRMFGDSWNDTPGSMVGVEYRDYGYSSTSVSPDVAMQFAESWKSNIKTDKRGNDTVGEPLRRSGVQLRILVPKGTGAIGVNTNEGELLLERGLRFRIVGDRVVDGDRLLDVEVLGV